MSLAYPVQTPPRMESVNDLYWHSEQTVARLLERLDLTRSELYAAIEPLPTGGHCAACGGVQVYTNRSARTAGRATCADCGLEAAEQAEDGGDSEDVTDDPFGSELAQAAGGMDHRVSVLQRDVQRERNQRAYALGGAAMLGAAVGAAVVALVRRS